MYTRSQVIQAIEYCRHKSPPLTIEDCLDIFEIEQEMLVEVTYPEAVPSEPPRNAYEIIDEYLDRYRTYKKDFIKYSDCVINIWRQGVMLGVEYRIQGLYNYIGNVIDTTTIVDNYDEYPNQEMLLNWIDQSVDLIFNLCTNHYEIETKFSNTYRKYGLHRFMKWLKSRL